MKIIPAIDLMNGEVVRLFKGDPNQKTVYSNNPVEIAKKWENSGADMLHLVDLDATIGLGDNYEILREISKNISIPVQVAGGLRDITKIANTLDFAERVVIGTLAMQLKQSEQEQILLEMITQFGKDRLVVSIDHIDGQIVTHGWQKNTGVKLLNATNEFVSDGFSEFLTTNVSKDGTLEGPDIMSLEQVCQINGTNIIASGGISKLEDVDEIKKCNPYGVILGKALYEGLISIEEAKTI
jgi:phosphoribosylformimino-5-aminoimidazole carboxamide ribotide isomerase|uniref:1-(5-phosphoribosyl)-5-[(5-phosphoribosylamino)methylideneamino] imidazole-4-carboxamide isomerase n=1 Tax=uncultured marine thaumarchaeote KM3_34_B07 TaxID=1456128 RepID=A0A075GYM2_9ARCH|nr:1-(5-phosphoribosyl)-5-((5-phosphoribosylamino)methylideneamino)imidazole-4-carboxamideisomerase (hisA) [uncultured marine thaumarchaeote KM3_34_B07]